MRILKEIDTLETAGVINVDTKERIKTYYLDQKSGRGTLSIMLGILGAVLVGLGVILLLAHNWDFFPKWVKTSIAFLPLIIAQSLCAYTLLKKRNNRTWIESSSTLLMFSIGSCMAMVSQIYNISGDLSEYLLTWIALSVPVLYIMRSNFASLLLISLITWYGHESNDSLFGFFGNRSNSYFYWPLILVTVPYVVRLYRSKKESSSLSMHFWFLVFSVLSMLIYVPDKNENLMIILLSGFFSLSYLLGRLSYFEGKGLRSNPFIFIGFIGSMALMYASGFSDFWSLDWSRCKPNPEVMIEPELLGIFLVTVIYLVLVGLYVKREMNRKMDLSVFIFPAFMLMLSLDHYHHLAAIIGNLIVLTLGIRTVAKGTRENNFWITNLGMLMLCILICCRFFDDEISFLIRGGLFLLLGIAFFSTNYYMLKKRQNHEIQ
jgi:uncharacterized membrane protein